MAESSFKYIVLGNSEFVQANKFKEFCAAGEFELVSCVNTIEDLYIACEKEANNALIVFDDGEIAKEKLQEVLTILKSSFHKMFICVFSKKSKYLNIDKNVVPEDISQQLCSALMEAKYVFFKDKREGFFVPAPSITKLFSALELKKKYKGYDYLKEAISLICRERKAFGSSIMKVYNYIGKVNNVSEASIERSIRWLLNESSLDLDYRKVAGTEYEYLAKVMQDGSNGEFISAVVEYLEDNVNI